MTFAVGAGVAVQSAADGARDADQGFQSGQTAMDGRSDGTAEQGPAGRDQRAVLDANRAERGGGEADHHARHTFVADQDVRSLAQDPGGHVRFVAASDEGGQLVDRLRLGEILGRPAQLEPGVHGHRLVLPHDILESAR